MKFSENWLREWVDIPVDRTELCHRLTMAGLEIESVQVLGEGLNGVVVGEIVECQPHPNADKLRVCKVNIGTNPLLQIVCGATNARVGLKAPLATLGAILPNGLYIEPANLRGVESQGMLCSAKELALEDSAIGLLELPAAAPLGQPLAQYLGLPDACIEMKLTPNRPDCLGLRGLAQDVAALFASRVQEPKLAPVVPVSAAQRTLRLQAGADCPRYLGRVIEDIQAPTTSPLWLVERLRRSGLRSISPVVDVTNYVMLELGQPLHAFDQDRIEGDLIVRRAHHGEVLSLLDGAKADLTPEFLVIADEQKALALAGVMGGYESRVSETTKNIFLESAYFAPSAVMGRARKLGLHTDASHRFERGVDPNLARLAMERATALLLDIVGGQAGPVIEAVLPDYLPQPALVRLRSARLERVLGMRVADVEVERILRALGMAVEVVSDGWHVTPPLRRFDIEIEEDLIEEVARVYGYDQVPVRAPSGQLRLALASEARLSDDSVRLVLTARGYFEAINYSFVAADELQAWNQQTAALALANPLSAELGVMRTSLLPGLLATLRHNRHRQQERVRLFELGRVFHADAATPVETLSLAAVTCGNAHNENWAAPARTVDFYDLKADLESLLIGVGFSTAYEFRPTQMAYLHPGRSAEIWYSGYRIGVIGNLHPRLQHSLDITDEVYVFELEFERIAAGQLPRAQDLPRYPSIRRDIAVVVPTELPFAQVQACIRGALGALLVDSVIFDQYAGLNVGTGLKSLAIGLILQDVSRTLTDQDADRCIALAVNALERECQAKLRG